MSNTNFPKIKDATLSQSKSSLWWVLACVGGLSIIVGVIIGSQKAGRMCGNVFNRKSGAAEIYDTLSGSPGGAARSCAESISAAAVPTWIFIVLGIVIVIAAAIIRNMPEKQPQQAVTIAAAPVTVQKSVTEKLEELDGLRQRGLVTDQEFEAKRKDLLDRM